MTQAQSSNYLGPDRRRLTLYVMRNTEYHLRDGVCVAVRDRRSGCWLPAHCALRRTLSGAVRYFSQGHAASLLAAPEVGDSLCFGPCGSGGRELVTSELSSVERPGRNQLAGYPSCPNDRDEGAIA